MSLFIQLDGIRQDLCVSANFFERFLADDLV